METHVPPALEARLAADGLEQDYEARDWSQKFGVSEDRLREAVGKVGNMAEDVERELRGS